MSAGPKMWDSEDEEWDEHLQAIILGRPSSLEHKRGWGNVSESPDGSGRKRLRFGRLWPGDEDDDDRVYLGADMEQTQWRSSSSSPQLYPERLNDIHARFPQSHSSALSFSLAHAAPDLPIPDEASTSSSTSPPSVLRSPTRPRRSSVSKRVLIQLENAIVQPSSSYEDPSPILQPRSPPSKYEMTPRRNEPFVPLSQEISRLRAEAQRQREAARYESYAPDAPRTAFAAQHPSMGSDGFTHPEDSDVSSLDLYGNPVSAERRLAECQEVNVHADEREHAHAHACPVPGGYVNANAADREYNRPWGMTQSAFSSDTSSSSSSGSLPGSQRSKSSTGSTSGVFFMDEDMARYQRKQ